MAATEAEESGPTPRRTLGDAVAGLRKHPLLSGLASLALFLTGAIVSSAIGTLVEGQINADEIDAARQQQAGIVAGTRKVEDGIDDLRRMLGRMQGADPAALDEFRGRAEAMLADLQSVVPVIEQAALSNANLIARIRHEALSRPDGATTTAALELGRTGSATICRDFTVGLSPYNDDLVSIRLSRRGETAEQTAAESGESTALRQPDASAAITLAGYGRGANGDMVGIDYNCFAGSGG